MTTQPKTPPKGGQASDLLNTTSMTASAIAGLRLDPSQLELTQGVPVVVDVPVAKAPPGQYWRAHAGEDFRAAFNLLDANKIGGEGMLLITPEVAGHVPDRVRPYELRLGVTQFGAPFLLPIPLPGPDGRINRWSLSLAAAAKFAEDTWIRIAADMRAGAYTVIRAGGNLGEPRWPEQSLEQLLEIAFRGNIVDSTEHPLVKQLRGEV